MPEPDTQKIIDWISQISSSKQIRHIMFVGGEPFLKIDALRQCIYHANKKGLITTVITNGFWAISQEKAVDILKSLKGLTCIIVSSDLYHLEFIRQEVIYNLLRACIKTGIVATVNITAASRQEGQKIKKIYNQFIKNNVQIVVSPMFSWGEATKLEIERFRYFDDISLLPKHCEVRNHHIDSIGRIYSCCGATLGNETDFLFLGDLNIESFDKIIKHRDINLLFNFIDCYGPHGLAELISKSPFINELKQKGFTQSCHLCKEILNNINMYKYVLETIRE